MVMQVPQIKQNPLTGQMLGIIANIIQSKFGREAQAEEGALQRDVMERIANQRSEDARLRAEREQEAARLAYERLAARRGQQAIFRGIEALPPGGAGPALQAPVAPGPPVAPRVAPAPRALPPARPVRQEPPSPRRQIPGERAFRDITGLPLPSGEELESGVRERSFEELTGGGLSLADEPTGAEAVQEITGKPLAGLPSVERPPAREGGPFGGLYEPRKAAGPEERYLLELKERTPRDAGKGAGKVPAFTKTLQDRKDLARYKSMLKRQEKGLTLTAQDQQWKWRYEEKYKQLLWKMRQERAGKPPWEQMGVPPVGQPPAVAEPEPRRLTPPRRLKRKAKAPVKGQKVYTKAQQRAAAKQYGSEWPAMKQRAIDDGWKME